MTKVIFTLALFIPLFSCRYANVQKECPGVNEVVRGARFRVNLPEEHKSGYLWQLSDQSELSALYRLNSVWHGDAGGIDFNFEARSAGNATLLFVKRKFTDTAETRCYNVRILAN